MQELEIQYLAKSIPKRLEDCKFEEVIDIYIPKEVSHPCLRIRKKGDNYEITKKTVVEVGHYEEQTVKLTEEEFKVLETVDGRKVHKKRYLYPYKGYTAEIDVFQGPLAGWVTVEVEFETMEDKNAFEMPSFCLADVTHEEFTAGGFVCGKSYEDIEENLKKYNYKKLFI
ncbi:adenylate cyclase [archaeon]|nr:adenylate cyclase [archaeon]MBL7056918.1 adenylate cyclase [Candidatus Woesearchaeota archaeon]